MAYTAMRVLLCAAVAAWTPPTQQVRRPTALHFASRSRSARRPTALHVEVSQMLYEQREKSIEQRGAFEEELIGSGGTSLEACAPSKLVSELLSEGVGRCDNVLDPQQADALKRPSLLCLEVIEELKEIGRRHRMERRGWRVRCDGCERLTQQVDGCWQSRKFDSCIR